MAPRWPLLLCTVSCAAVLVCTLRYELVMFAPNLVCAMAAFLAALRFEIPGRFRPLAIFGVVSAVIISWLLVDFEYAAHWNQRYVDARFGSEPHDGTWLLQDYPSKMVRSGIVAAISVTLFLAAGLAGWWCRKHLDWPYRCRSERRRTARSA